MGEIGFDGSVTMPSATLQFISGSYRLRAGRIEQDETRFWRTCFAVGRLMEFETEAKLARELWRGGGDRQWYLDLPEERWADNEDPACDGAGDKGEARRLWGGTVASLIGLVGPNNRPKMEIQLLLRERLPRPAQPGRCTPRIPKKLSAWSDEGVPPNPQPTDDVRHTEIPGRPILCTRLGPGTSEAGAEL